VHVGKLMNYDYQWTLLWGKPQSKPLMHAN